MKILCLLVELALFATCFSAPVKKLTLAKAMDFLKEYGYLTDSYDNESGDKRKDMLYTAMMHFQLYAGLEITGKLNDEAMEMMMQPRCGRPDMENGRLKRYAFSGSKRRKPEITYRVNNYTERLSPSVINSELDAAFKIWTKYANLKMQKIDSRADIEIFFSRQDGPSNVLAYAYFPPSHGMYFDVEERWTTNNGNLDLYQVAAHEMGHSLGLDHSEVHQSIMTPYHNPRATYRNDLHKDDIDAIKAIYGEKETLRTMQNKFFCDKNKMTAAFYYKNILYIIKGDTYVSVEKNGKISEIKNMRDTWKVNRNSKAYSRGNRIYFFSGNEFWKYKDDVMDSRSPRKISDGFPGIPNDIDAVVPWRNKILFMKGGQYWVFDYNTTPRVLPIYPKQMKDDFNGLPTEMDLILSMNDDGLIYVIKDKMIHEYDDTLKATKSRPLNTIFKCN